MRNWEFQDGVLVVNKKPLRRRFSRLFSSTKKSSTVVIEPKQEEKRRMPDVYFAFGPSHSYALFAGQTSRLLNVPEQLKRYVLKSLEAPEKRLQRPQCIALGPTESEYYAMYTTWENTDRYTYDFQNSHSDLMTWFKPLSKIVGSHIAVGPCRTVYACIPTSTGGGTYYSPNIPPSLKTLLDASSSVTKRKFTTHVSLGYGGSWFVLWPNGDTSWDFAGNYPELEEVLKALPEKSVSYCALNPWAAGQWFLVLEDGTTKFCLPAEWATDIEQDIAEWQSRYKTVTTSTVKGGETVNTESQIKLTEKKSDLVIGTGNKQGSKGDAPPPYEGKKGNK